MIVYLARDIQAFVMYCVNGTSRSSLLIESTDSMIIYIYGNIMASLTKYIVLFEAYFATHTPSAHAYYPDIVTSRNAKHCGASLSDERVTI